MKKSLALPKSSHQDTRLLDTSQASLR